MRLRKLLLATIGGVVVASATNSVLRHRAGPPANPVAGRAKRYRWRGMDLAYTEAGDAGDQSILLVHGIHAAGSGHQFESIVPGLASDFHVIVPDLPGFGRSDRPPIDYTPDVYAAFLRAFTADVTPNAVCVGSSLGGVFAAMAARDGAPVRQLVLVCPIGSTVPQRPWLNTIVRTPIVGESLFNLLASKPSIRWHATHLALRDDTVLTEATVADWWRTAHQSGARFAPAAFLSGQLDPPENLSDIIASVPCPVTLVWGREATMPSLADGRDLAAASNAKLVVFDHAKLLPEVEYPDEFVAFLTEEAQAVQS